MRSLLFCVLCVSLLAHAVPAAPPAAGEKPPLRARLDKETIRAAIAASPDKGPAPGRSETGALSGTPYEKFSKDFAGARLPDCLHSEGLKYQPTFFLNGVLALPFIAVAKLRGVCR
jgi:hypothetical protein